MTGPDLALFGPLDQFRDALDFLFYTRESNTGGVTVGGEKNLSLLWVHVELSVAAMVVACLIAVPLGLLLGHTGRFQLVATSVANVGRAVPSIALIALFVAFIGTGNVNVTLALILLAIPPILTNTYVGIRQVDPGVVDAARGQGLGALQIVRSVELPLALPLILGGIRTSAVNVVATAAIAPLAGPLTLGDLILNASVYGSSGVLAGAIAVALLALAVEFGLGGLQRIATPRGIRPASRAHRRRGRVTPTSDAKVTIPT